MSRSFHGRAGVIRVDDRRVLNGILFVIRNGLRWRGVPAPATAVLDELPAASHLLADRAYSSTGFPEALISPASRLMQAPCSARL